MEKLQLWHGGGEWHSAPEVRSVKAGRYEAGPGIYLTTSYERARKYSKGQRRTSIVTLKPAEEIRWLETAKLPTVEVLAFAHDTPRLRNRKQLIADLNRYDTDMLPGSYLVNLCINNEVLVGATGPVLASWLVTHGIDASLHSPKTGEQWVVVFNPEIILKQETVSPSKVDLALYNLPEIDKPTKDKA